MIIKSLKKRCHRETLLLNISSASEIEVENCFQRTSRDFSLYKQHIKVLRDQFKNDLKNETFVLRFLKISESQITALKLYT